MTAPALDRLFRHMAWANAEVFAKLQSLPDHALTLTLPGSENTISEIADHLATAAGGYAERLGRGLGTPPPPPTRAADLAALGRFCASADAALRELAQAPEATAAYEREGKLITRANSTILAQSIHHATEHRAQIATALSANGFDLLDLDELDLWTFGDFEGRGE